MAAYGAIRVPVACLSASSSACNDAALSKSPNQTAIIAWPLSAIDSGASAPALRASSIWRVLTAFQLSKSQRVTAADEASTPHWSHCSTDASSPRNACTARRSDGAAAARPSAISAASPSSSRSDGPSGRGAGGAALAARETASRLPPGWARRPANIAAPHASRYVPRARSTSSGSSR